MENVSPIYAKWTRHLKNEKLFVKWILDVNYLSTMELRLTAIYHIIKRDSLAKAMQFYLDKDVRNVFSSYQRKKLPGFTDLMTMTRDRNDLLLYYKAMVMGIRETTSNRGVWTLCEFWYKQIERFVNRTMLSKPRKKTLKKKTQNTNEKWFDKLGRNNIRQNMFRYGGKFA